MEQVAQQVTQLVRQVADMEEDFLWKVGGVVWNVEVDNKRITLGYAMAW